MKFLSQKNAYKKEFKTFLSEIIQYSYLCIVSFNIQIFTSTMNKFAEKRILIVEKIKESKRIDYFCTVKKSGQTNT